MFITSTKNKRIVKDPKKLKQIEAWKQSDISKISSTIHRKEKAKFDITTEFLDNCINFHKDEIESMLKSGKANIDSADKDNLTALHQACINAKLELVTYLLSKNANINAVDKEGWTPLHIAASIGSLELAKCLIDKGARLDLVNYDGDLPIALVDEKEGKELKLYLDAEMSRRNINEENCRNMERNVMMEDILKWKSSGIYEPPIDNIVQFTPLHVAASKNYLDILRELTLLLMKEQLNARDMDGWTALHAAAHWGNLDACLILLKAGADMDAVTKANETVIDIVDPLVKEKLIADINRFRLENLRTIEIDNQVLTRNEGANKRSAVRTSIARQSVQMKKFAQSKDPVLERQIHEAAHNNEPSSTSSSIDDDYDKANCSRSHNFASIFEGEESSTWSNQRDSLEDSQSQSTISVTSPCISYQNENNRPISASSSVIIAVNDKASNTSQDKLHLLPTNPSSDGDNNFVSFENGADNTAICDLSTNSTIFERTINDSAVQMRPKRTSLVMAPAKCDESEANRREKSRRIRSNRRSTQGINLETVDAIKKRQNEIENGNLDTISNSNPSIPEESAVDVIDSCSEVEHDRTSHIIVDDTITDDNKSCPEPINSMFSKMVPKSRISTVLDSLIKSQQMPINNDNSTIVAKAEPSPTNVIISPLKFVKKSEPMSTEQISGSSPRMVTVGRVDVADGGIVAKIVDSGSFVARPMSGTGRLKSNDTPASTSLRGSVSAVSGARPNVKYQNSINTVDSVDGVHSRTIANSLTNNQIVIKEQNIEIQKLKERIKELESSQHHNEQSPRNVGDDTEISRIKTENRNLKTQNESLLRVIDRIQKELHSLYPPLQDNE